MKYVSTIDKIVVLETRLVVMKAFTKGNTIQLRHLSSTEWHDLTAPSPTWDWELYDYRVKPEPHPKTATAPQANVGIPAYLRDVADKLEQGKIKPLYNVILVMVE